MNDIHTIGFPDYRIEVGNATFALIDPRTGHVLFTAASPLLLRPELHGRESAWTVQAVRVEPAAAVRHLERGKHTLTIHRNDSGHTHPDYMDDLMPQMPPGVPISVSCKIRTIGVSGGKGAFLRLRRVGFEWRPTPCAVFADWIEAPPVNGDSQGWVDVGPIEITSPAPPGDEDFAIELALDGKGEARFGALEIKAITSAYL